MLWYLPLEYLDKRYTKLMDKQFKRSFSNLNIDFTEITGKMLTDEIETGAFLDSDSTNYFKFSQLQEVCKLFKNQQINDKDVFFVSDLWFPGLISIPYMAMFHNIEIDICGIFHAGSWTDTDYVRKLKYWAKQIEQGWFKMCSSIFVGSEFHKMDIFLKNRCLDKAKIHVTGLPFDSNDILNERRKELIKNKQNIVIFNGRLDDEKQPFLFHELEKKIKSKNPEIEFIKTLELNLNKEEYFDLLSNSKVVFSAALQENYGYGILEAVALGCTPVVPNRLSYKEMYPYYCKYNTIDEAEKMILFYIDNHKNISDHIKKYDFSADNIVKIIKEKYYDN